MKIRVRDQADNSTVVGEMGDGEMGVIAEMVTDPANLKSFGFSDTVVQRAEQLRTATEDDKPEFPVVRVEEGWSGSRRLWPAREIDSIVSQTNALEPVGNLGHIPDEQYSTSFGDPQTTWIGAIAKTEASQQKDRIGEMVRVGYFAGYNHPGAKIRNLIKTRAVRGISWWGKADQVAVPGKGVEVRGFTLQALDWARKLSEGMPTSRIVGIAKEMEDQMDKELSQVTPEEYERENPNGYALLVQRINHDHEKVVGEMETKVAAGDAAKEILADIRKTLKLDDNAADADILTTLAAAMAKIGTKAKALLKDALDKALMERIPGEGPEVEQQRAIVRRLLPIGEMQSALEDASEGTDTDKLVGEMVDDSFNKDETLKTIVGEQQPASLRRREQIRGNGSDSAITALGMERGRRTVGA